MIILNVPYAERATAARLGAKFDPVRKAWCVPTGALAAPFERWLPKFEAPAKRKARGQREARSAPVVEVDAVPAGVDDMLRALAESWRASARACYQCADRTDDPKGKHVMNSTAMVLFNCSQELTAALDGVSPQPLATP